MSNSCPELQLQKGLMGLIVIVFPSYLPYTELFFFFWKLSGQYLTPILMQCKQQQQQPNKKRRGWGGGGGGGGGGSELKIE